MNELQKFELPEKYCKATTQSLIFEEGTPYEVWEKVGEGLKKIGGAVQLWLGDWLNFGERKYGEKYSQALENTHYEYSTLKEFASVAKRTEEIRKVATSPLLMGQWDVIADIKDIEKQKQWMKKCEEKQLTVQELREAIKQSKKSVTPPLHKGKYEIIYADPPWDYGQEVFLQKEKGVKAKGHSSAELHYPVMSVDEIKQLNIQSLADENCLLFMWSSSPHLEYAIQIINAWGFEYKTIAFVWDKQKINPSAYTLSQVEICLVAKKGNIPEPRGLRNVHQFLSEERTEHSKKPDEIRKRIETMFPTQKKIELFARGTSPKGWTCWGNEVPK